MSSSSINFDIHSAPTIQAEPESTVQLMELDAAFLEQVSGGLTDQAPVPTW